MSYENNCAVFYGRIDFLGSNGIIGETALYLDYELYRQEIRESFDCGRPISYKKLTPFEFWSFIKGQKSIWF